MIRIVQVGIGNWGRSWTEVVKQDARFELVACVDMSAGALELLQGELGISSRQCFLDLEAALQAVPVDAVLVTTSLAAHIPVALIALEHGKHVLVEKPFAASVAEAAPAVELAAAQERILMVSQNYRFSAAPRLVASLVKDRALGPVDAVTIDFRHNAKAWLPAENPYFQRHQPLLVDMAIHHFDLMRMILAQEPQDLFCRTWYPVDSGFTDPPAAAAIITFDGGTVVSYRGNWSSTRPRTAWAGEWHLECAGGEISWTSRGDRGAKRDRAMIRPWGEEEKALELSDPSHLDRAGSLDAFAKAIQTGQEPETSGRDNLKTLALMEAMLASVSSGTTVQVVADPPRSVES